MLLVAALATDALWGRSAGWQTGYFTVWKVQPRRVQMLSSKLGRGRSGAVQPAVAAFPASRLTAISCHLVSAEFSLRPPLLLTRGVDLHMRHAGIIRTRLASFSNRTPTTKTVPSSKPLSSIYSLEAPT
jgi:hypothetical protein